jgi:hypothetical protein
MNAGGFPGPASGPPDAQERKPDKPDRKDGWAQRLLSEPRVTLKRAQTWLLGHLVAFIAAIALLLGAYLTVSGIVRLA